MSAMRVFWFLPLLLFPVRQVAVVGDSLTLAQPGYVDLIDADADRFVCYHLADCIVDWPDQHYDVLIVELGIHAVVGCDHLPGHDLDVFRARYERVLDLAAQSADAVIVVNIPALWTRETELERVQAYNTVIAEGARDRAVPVADAFAVTVDCKECIDSDGFHPSEIGYQLISESILEAYGNHHDHD